MTVILTSAVEGGTPGDEYTGPNEAWLVENGYAAVIDIDDFPDLDHLDGADWPDEVVPESAPLTPSEHRYSEFDPETAIQSTVADTEYARAASTKRRRSSDGKPAADEAPDEAPEVDEED